MRTSLALVFAIAAAPWAMPAGAQSASPPQQAAPAKKAAPAKPAWTPPRLADGHLDFNGVWSNASIVPLERPQELEGKQFLTPEEKTAYEQKVFARSSRERPRPGGGVGTYNDFWWDADSKRAQNFRTSLIVDPPDGKVPPLTAEAQKRVQADRAYSREHPADGPEDRTLLERCILFPTTGPPMLPSFYNNSVFGPLTTNYEFVQTPEYLTIVIELNHDVRVIPLDGRPHPPSKIRQWLGDSRGHWEGNTLVVDTTNFTGVTKFKGADENLHLTERFTRIASDTLLYEFTMDDPTAFTKPWKGEIPMIAGDGPLFEHACNEGNYGLAGILGGARADERKALK
ncbi:MAG TPA: hypothetical protein VN841_22400 [Bryobacteraceae bacterium]|nr:hypothetical protein [Bryobacteraceae bacterium]